MGDDFNDFAQDKTDEELRAGFDGAHARPNGAGHKAPPPPPFEERDEGATAEEELQFIDLPSWEGKPIPEREWAVLDRIPARNVTLLSGDGAVGKTTVVQQLAVATVLKKDWLGLTPAPGPVMMVLCEDDEAELLRRFAKIADFYGASFSALRDLHPISLVGKNTVLGAANRNGIVQPTDLYRRLLGAARYIKPKIVCLDNAADVFAINENDRFQVRQAIGLLRRFAIEVDTAVVLTSHPSLTGVTNGSGLSGSTAWHASVRARLYMQKPKPDSGEKADPDARVLECMKSNYGPPAESIALRWQNGLFIPVEGVHWADKRAVETASDDLFLRLLGRFREQGRNVSDNKCSPNYAPTLFAKDPDAIAKSIKKNSLGDAMARLFATGKIHVETYGRPSRLI